MLPPPPVAIFPPAAAMLPRGPPQFAAPYPPPIFYWPYPSPPVSPTNYYNPANVGGIAAIPQQAALVSMFCLCFILSVREILNPRVGKTMTKCDNSFKKKRYFISGFVTLGYLRYRSCFWKSESNFSLVNSSLYFHDSVTNGSARFSR